MDDPIRDLVADPAATLERLLASPLTRGVSLAVADGDDVRRAGDPDVATRPGSVVKLLTAELVRRHVDLDDPVDRHLPGFDGVLVRHLISHTSGIDAGDVFVDTGGGDDAVERYVDVVRGSARLFAPGAAFSYCNAGFVIAARIVEVVTGRTWDDAVRDVVPGARVEARPDLGPVTTRGLGPAGGNLVCTAADLAAFVVEQLADPGAEVLRRLQAWAPGGVAEMVGPAMGWMVWRNAAQSSVRIAGAWPGCSAIIAADPPTRRALVAMFDVEPGVNAVTALLDAVGPPPLDLERYVGEYASHAATFAIEPDGDGGLRLRFGEGTVPLSPGDGTTFASPMGPIAFHGPDHLGRPQHLRWRMRTSTRR